MMNRIAMNRLALSAELRIFQRFKAVIHGIDMQSDGEGKHFLITDAASMSWG